MFIVCSIIRNMHIHHSWEIIDQNFSQVFVVDEVDELVDVFFGIVLLANDTAYRLAHKHDCNRQHLSTC